MSLGVKKKFTNAKKKVQACLDKYEVKLRKCEMIIDPSLEKEIMIRKGYPCYVMVSKKNISESAIARCLINIAQNKIDEPDNVKYVYSLLIQGCSDFILSDLYTKYDILNPLGCKLIGILEEKADSIEGEKSIIKELFNIEDIEVRAQEADMLINSDKVSVYFKELLKPRIDMVKRALQAADELNLQRPDYLPFGEELKAWIFITQPKFDVIWNDIDKIIKKFYA